MGRRPGSAAGRIAYGEAFYGNGGPRDRKLVRGAARRGDGPLPHAGPPASARAPFDQSGGGGRRGGVRGRRRGRLRDRRHRAAPQLRDPQGFEPFEGVAYHRRQRRSRAAGRNVARARDRHGIRGPFPGDVRGLQGPGGDPAVENRPAGSGGRRRLPRRVRRGRLPRAGGRRAAGRRRGGGTGAARGVHDARWRAIRA